MTRRNSAKLGVIALAGAALLLGSLGGCASNKPKNQPHDNSIYKFRPPSMTGDDQSSAALFAPGHGPTGARTPAARVMAERFA